MARGSGAGLAVVLTVARRAGSSAGAAEYDPPHVRGLEPFNAPPLASGNVSISGASFGAVDASPGTPLPSRTEWTRLVPPPVLTGHVSPLPQAHGWAGAPARPRAGPPTPRCNAAAARRACAGAGGRSLCPPPPLSYQVDTPRPSSRTNRTRRVPGQVTVAGGVGTSARLFSFDAPNVTGVARAGAGGPGASADVLLFGRNFGTADHSFAARLPPAGCNSTVWVADSAIRCRLPGGPPQVRSHLLRRGIEL